MKKREIDDLITEKIKKSQPILNTDFNQPLNTTELRKLLALEIEAPWATIRDHLQKMVLDGKIVRAERVGTDSGQPIFQEAIRGGLLLTSEYYVKYNSRGLTFALEVQRRTRLQANQEIQRLKRKIEQQGKTIARLQKYILEHQQLLIEAVKNSMATSAIVVTDGKIPEYEKKTEC